MKKNESKVVTHFCENFKNSEHEAATIEFIAKRAAGLLSRVYAGKYSGSELLGMSNNPESPALYFVPSETLLATEACALGIQSASHMLGGCVPYPFVASKCITHALIDSASAFPTGWTNNFSDSVHHVTLPGFSAFSKADALIAAQTLLKSSELRIKAPLSRGGNGQKVVNTIEDAERFLQSIDDDDFSEHGVVLEANLRNVITRSIGTVSIGSIQISYCGSQTTTLNARGESVYGGSSLRAVRGGFNNLLQLDWSRPEIIAIEQAMIYDFAADTCFDGFFASRRNYDVAQGYDSHNKFCSGVLEQSWRVGGASPAEIVAMEAFANDPSLVSVRTSCHEVHRIAEVDDDCVIYFRGEDADVGTITKFARVDAYEYGARAE
jgi:hypothetical protein